MRYAIYEGNMDRLQKKMVRIQNKCRKYGCDFRFEEVGEEFRDKELDNGDVIKVRYVVVEAEGTAIINDWKFIASLDWTEKGNVINRACDIEVPVRYYDSYPVCEHCGNTRVRHTFIVMNTKNGEFKQVGRNCLCDYTHGMRAEGVAQYISAFDELIQGEATDGGWNYTRYYSTEEYLRYVAETIRHFGYVKSDGYSRSTASRAEDYFGVDHGWHFLGDLREQCENEMIACGFNAESAEAVKTVQDAVAWLKDQEDNSNYMHNLKVAVSLECIASKHFGILASLFPTFDRELERQDRIRRETEAGKSSEWVGEIGKRITVKYSSAKTVTSWDTMFGTTYIWKIVGEDGNIYTWKTGNHMPEVGEVVGTVKEHTEFRGVKQTELTRCRVA